MKKIKLYFLLLTFLPIPLHAQRIQNVRFEQEGKKVNIYYDIIGAKSSDDYEVKVYCSTAGLNGFDNSPLRKVSGDVGKGIQAGYGKKVTWDVLAEVEQIKSNQVAFKVIAEKPQDLPWLEMVYVEGGTFMMGSKEGEKDERPIHEVEVGDFYIGKYEVTQAQWLRIMGSNPSRFENCNECPVERVSWNDVQEFMKKLNLQTKQIYRLPTEAEWEFAAKGGKKSNDHIYAGGNNISSLAWIRDNSNNTTHPVGLKNPNELGIYDLSGNVFEMCLDWYEEDYYSNSPNKNPQGPSSGNRRRVKRGGSWGNAAIDLRISNRNYVLFTSDNTGFRLVREKT